MSESSRLAKWRVLVSLAWIDGELVDSEKDWLRELYKLRVKNQADRDQLEYDIANGVSLNDVLPLVTEKKHLAEICHLANLLFAVDGEVCWEEKEILKQIKALVMKDINLGEAIGSAIGAKHEILEKRAHRKRLDRIERMARMAFWWD